MAQSADAPQGAPREDDPRLWLGPSRLVDLEDPKLRLRVHALVQLCKNDREKAVAVYAFVKRMPVVRRLKFRVRTARAVLDAGCGDASEKATLLVAMLRIAGIPARLRYVTLKGEILRGLRAGVREADRALVEAWVGDGWQQTDTYIYDAATMAAARQRLKDRGWTWGYGIHVEGRMLWDAQASSWMGGRPEPGHPMLVRDLGVFQDHVQFRSSVRVRRRPLWRMQWNIAAPLMNRALRGLRDEGGGSAHAGRTS